MDTLLFHPKLVHIPMALGILMPLVAAGLLLAWWRNWFPRRVWLIAVVLQAILFGSGLLALRSGEAEQARVERIVAERVIEEHEEAAESFVWASGAALLLMSLATVARSRKSGLLVAAAATLGTIVVLGLGYRTGRAGGSLVYEHGAARAYASSTSPRVGRGTPGIGDAD